MLSQLAKGLVPYTAGEQPRDRRYVKLNTNENPYPPSPEVDKILRSLDAESLKLYPDPDCTRLRDVLAEKEGVERGNIFVGNGSDEVLAVAFAALFDKVAPVKFADVTYSFYPVYCRLWGLPYETVPLDGKFMLARGGFCDCGGVVIANPNAPTGIYEDVSEFIGANFPVIIDEAYIDFADGKSLAGAASQSENAVVVKTFSKSYSLAGARCGYAVASRENIEGLDRVKNSFNSYTVNALTQAVAAAAAKDKEYFSGTVAKIKATREKYRGILNAMGYECTPSSANFLFAKVPSGDGGRAYAGLKEKGVLVRWFNAPGISDRLRITVGTEEEMKALVAALKTL